MLNQTPWNNIYITMETVGSDSWKTKGIQYVNYFLNENGHFISHTRISNKWRLTVIFYRLYKSDKAWRAVRTQYSYKSVREPFIYHDGTVLQSDNRTEIFIYECYVQIKYVTPTSVLEWKTVRLDLDMSEEECIDVFFRHYNSLRKTKLE